MADEFDPAEHNVDEVNAELDQASAGERDRILAAEAAGKGRKSVLEPAGADPEERQDASGRVLNPWEVSPADHYSSEDANA